MSSYMGEGMPTYNWNAEYSYLAIGGGHRQPEHFARLSC